MRFSIPPTQALLTAFFTAFLACCSMNAEPSFKTPVSYEDADKRADEVLSKLSVEERLQLITGSNTFFIKGFPQYGMPELYLADATQGVNIRRNLSNQLEKSVSFPAAISLASTWNPTLANQYAKSIGEECRAGGVAVLLGPGMNIYRNSQCGRNFEYFGEDPLLAASMIERYVMGVLDTGTIPTLKHFFANNTDFHRRTSNSVLDERTMHEIYLPAFKAGIDAGAMAVMTSYNQVNGDWAGQSNFVISQLLRKELGFKWLVMTDWWSVWDAKKIIESGQDLEMPGEKFIKSDGLRLLKAGQVSQAQIDRMAKSIIRTCIAMGFYDRPVKDSFFLERYAEHEKAALQTAREGIVLLRNRDQLLPLKRESVKHILLTGTFVEKLARGGGAADVEGYDVVTLLQALKDTYGDRVEYVKAPTDEQLKSAEAVLLSIGTNDSEGWDRPFALPDSEENLVKRVAALNPRTVVIMNTGGGVKMSDWNDQTGALIYAWYPGQLGNKALAEIICGDVNPSGKMPITIEKRYEDSPAFGDIPAGSKFYTGWEADSDMSQPIINVNYKEGVFVGYRWYESKKIAPLYAFGHGLSYTSFSYGKLRIVPDSLSQDGRVSIEFSVTNTGKVAGAEVAQLYIREIAPSVSRPLKELKGFSKVTLQPGETRTVRIRLVAKHLAFWDVSKHDWSAKPGEYRVFVGGASDSIALEGGFRLE